LNPEQQKLIDDNLEWLGKLVTKERWRFPGLDRDEMFQEAYFGLRKAAKYFNPARGAFGNYCYTVVLNQLRRFQGKERKHRLLHYSNAGCCSPVIDESHVQLLTDYNLDLDETLKKIHVRDRPIIELRFRDGLTVSKIADVLGVNECVVHQRIKMALRRVATRMQFVGPGKRKRGEQQGDQ
jgi:RNA polymerase sigma factor (sigma-70 family)